MTLSIPDHRSSGLETLRAMAPPADIADRAGGCIAIRQLGLIQLKSGQ